MTTKLPEKRGPNCSECAQPWWMHVDAVKLRNMGHVAQGYTDEYTEVPGRIDLADHPVTTQDCSTVAKRIIRESKKHD